MKKQPIVAAILAWAFSALPQAPLGAQQPAPGQLPAGGAYRLASDEAPLPPSVYDAHSGPVLHEPGTVLSGSCPESCRSTWYVGAAAVFLEPEFDSNTAFFIEDQTAIPTSVSNEEFEFSHEAAPRVWIGRQGASGWGARVTWFQIEDDSTTAATAPVDFIFFNGPGTPTVAGGLFAGGTAGDTIFAEHDFELYTIDVDILKELNFSRWQTTLGAGYRHLGVSNQYQAQATAGGFPVSSEIGHRFDGDGPTFFGELRLPIARSGGRDRRHARSASLLVFTSARGSVLFGETKYGALDTNPPFVDAAFIREDQTVAVAELQAGLQADFRTMSGTLIFLRAAWESQWYRQAGTAADPDGDFGLHGVQLAAGLDW